MSEVHMDLKRHHERAVVIATRRLGSDYHLLTLRARRIAEDTRAGQFVLIGTRRVDDGSADPLLPRPLSILGRDPADGTIELLYRVLGRGTRLMTLLSPGEEVAVTGPLGKPWPEPSGDMVLVAGGVGMPPILHLAEQTARVADPERRITLFYGGRSCSDLHLIDRFEAAGVEVSPCAEDGTSCFEGSCVDALESWLADGNGDGATIYACGPEGMLAAVASIAEARKMVAYVSLEAPMACGIGVCRGCAVKARDGGFRMVCTDGPVFNAGEVVFE